MLKTGDDIVGVAHVDDVAVGLVVSPPLGPQVEGVMKVDVGEHRGNHCPLRGTGFARAPLSIGHHPSLQPFADQADHARIADPMFDETDEPFVTHRVEKRSDVDVDNPVHLRLGDPDRKRVQRIMLAASGPEPVREPQKVFLVDRIEHLHHRTLDDLVFQRSDPKRPLLVHPL